MLDVISQAAILVLGGAAIALLACRRQSVSRWGWLAGLLSQPFWLYATWPFGDGGGQWGMFILSAWYTWHWARGTRNFLVRGKACREK